MVITNKAIISWGLEYLVVKCFEGTSIGGVLGNNEVFLIVMQMLHPFGSVSSKSKTFLHKTSGSELVMADRSPSGLITGWKVEFSKKSFQTFLIICCIRIQTYQWNNTKAHQMQIHSSVLNGNGEFGFRQLPKRIQIITNSPYPVEWNYGNGI